jgi:hypothetical protein
MTVEEEDEMAEERGDGIEAVEHERELREQERKAKEHEPTEEGPEQRRTAEPGAPVFPAQKSPGS